MASTTKLKGIKVWRYTVERLDQEDGVVRLERVPLAKGIEVERFVDKLAVKEKESLEWWDVKNPEICMLSIKKCRKNLHLEGQKLVENMVFWVLLKGQKVKRVIHATQAARELSSELYSHLIPRPQGAKDAKKSN